MAEVEEGFDPKPLLIIGIFWVLFDIARVMGLIDSSRFTHFCFTALLGLGLSISAMPQGRQFRLILSLTVVLLAVLAGLMLAGPYQ